MKIMKEVNYIIEKIKNSSLNSDSEILDVKNKAVKLNETINTSGGKNVGREVREELILHLKEKHMASGVNEKIHVFDIIDKIVGEDIGLDNDRVMFHLKIGEDILNTEIQSDEFKKLRKTIHSVGTKTSYYVLDDILDALGGFMWSRDCEKTKIEVLYGIEKLYAGIDEDLKEGQETLGLAVLLAAEKNDMAVVDMFGRMMPKITSFLAKESLSHFKEEIENMKVLMESERGLGNFIKNSYQILFEVKIKTGVNILNYMQDEEKEEFVNLVLENKDLIASSKIKGEMKRIVSEKVRIDKTSLKKGISGNKVTLHRKKKI